MQKTGYRAYNLQLRKEIEQALKQLQIQRQVISYSKQDTKNHSILQHDGPTISPPTFVHATFTQTSLAARGLKQQNKKEMVCQKIAEIIHLCSDNQKYREIKEAEEQVLSILQLGQRQAKELKRRQQQVRKREGQIKEDLRININQDWKMKEKKNFDLINPKQQKINGEINRLRYDNLNLMKSLNKQIKEHNKEKIKSKQAKKRIEKVKSTPHFISHIQPRVEPAKRKQKKQLTVPPHLERSLSNFSHSRKSSKPKIQNRYQEHTSPKQTNERYKTINGQALGRLAQSVQYYQMIPFRTRIADGQTIEQFQNHGCPNSPEASNKLEKNYIYPQSYRAIQLKEEKQLKKKRGHNRNIVINKKTQDQHVPSLAEIQALLLQGADLSKKGQRLIKVKSNPQLFKNNLDENTRNYEKYRENERKIHKDRYTFEGQLKDYEKFIYEMRSASEI